MKPNIIVDARGLFCPVPIMKTSEAIGAVDSGRIVEIIADDPAIELDMRAWCHSQGHTIESAERNGDVFHFRVRKTGTK